MLANCAPKDSSFTSDSTTNDFLKAVSYESIASVLRQCDRVLTSNSFSPNSTLSTNVSFASSSLPYNSSGDRGRRELQGRKQRLTPEQIAELNTRTKCHRCGKYGHWTNDHRKDGAIKQGSNLSTPQQVAARTRRMSLLSTWLH